MTKSSRSSIRHESVIEILATQRLSGDGPLSQQVCRLLQALIGQLRLLPNQFLSEKEVADGLRVSRTPVREAFIRLAEDGKVQIIPKSGTYVAPIDSKRIDEGLFIWRVLESSCASRVAENISFGGISQLRDCVSLQRHCLAIGDEKGFHNANTKFHSAIFSLSDFPGAEEMMQNAKFEVSRLLGLYEKNEFDMTDAVVNEQWRIVNAMAEHRNVQVSKSMELHLMRVKSMVDAILAEKDGASVLQRINRKKSGRRQSRTGGEVHV